MSNILVKPGGFEGSMKEAPEEVVFEGREPSKRIVDCCLVWLHLLFQRESDGNSLEVV